MNGTTWIITGGIFGALGVTLGAFGSHALPGWLVDHGRSGDELTKAIASFETAARYQMYHALALVLVGLLARQMPARLWDVAAMLFVVGILIFSGMLYAWVLTNVKTFAMIVPLGGLAMIAGWVVLSITAFRSS